MSARRGQALVLFSLVMLLLTLMVLVTIGISSRAHDRMEAQIAADTAAYSEAVLTARAFNTISLINRAQVSEMVGMAATESLISWSGAALGHFEGLQVALATAKTTATPACQTSIQTIINALAAKVDSTYLNTWNQKDDAAGQQAEDIQGISSGMRTWQTDTLKTLVEQLSVAGPTTSVSDSYGTLLAAGAGKDMVKKIAQAANPDLSSAPGGDWKSVKEAVAAPALANSSPTKDSVDATMGSRGDSWVTSRGGNSVAPRVTNWSGITVTGGSESGGSGFGKGMHGSQTEGGADSYAAWAHDHAGSVTFTLTCSDGTTMSLTDGTTDAYVYSSEQQQTDDKHVYGLPDKPPGRPVDQRHTMGSCVVCDGIWPFFLDYDSTNVGNAQNLDGQPVLYAVVHRDYSQVPADPWNLLFNDKFAKGGSGQVFDNGNKAGKMSTNLAYREQVALSAGLAYYHRYQHAREPPNFFNPFWRATLVPADVDQSNAAIKAGTADAHTALQKAGFGPHAAALKQLEKAGYTVTELSP